MTEPKVKISHANVRWSDQLGWMLRCDVCVLIHNGSAWWPLTDEFWDKRHGMTRCRACWKARDRAWHRKMAPEVVRARNEKNRAYKAEWARRYRRIQREEREKAA